MPEPKSHRLKPTPAMEARIRKAIAEEEQPAVVAANKARGREVFREMEAQQADDARGIAQRMLSLLRARRQQQQLSLTDLQERTGIHRSNLSRLLDDDAEPNITLATVARLAEAMHCRVNVTLEPTQ